VNTEILIALTQGGYLPVVSPVAVGEDGKAYNVNADTAAGAIAAQMRARRLIYMTDVRGIYEDLKDESTFIQSLNEKRLEQLKKDGRISEGMIPKIESAFEALRNGVEKVHVIDGRIEHSLILELFTEEGIGTEIVL
jgi:acetylglutamate kinase